MALIHVIAGEPAGHEGPAPSETTYTHRGRVVGVLGWNSPRELRTLRRLVVDAASSPWFQEMRDPTANAS
jgi:hypothetical protein